MATYEDKITVLNETETSEKATDVEVTDDGLIRCSTSKDGDEEERRDDEENPHTKRQLIGATLAGCLAGWFLCGGSPLGALVGGSGAALAVSSKSKVGDVTRQGGEAVAKVGDQIKKLEEEHHIVENVKQKSGEAVATVGKSVKSIEEKHHIAEKTGKAVTKVGDSLKTFEEKHHVVENVKETTGKVASKVVVEPIKKFEEKHHIVEGVKQKGTEAITQVKSFEEEHHIIKEVGDTTKKGWRWTTKRLKPKDVVVAPNVATTPPPTPSSE